MSRTCWSAREARQVRGMRPIRACTAAARSSSAGSGRSLTDSLGHSRAHAPLGLCVAWLRNPLATFPPAPEQRPGQNNRVFYNVTVWKSDPPYRGPPPNSYGQIGDPIGRSDSDVECKRISPDSLAYQSLEKRGRWEGGLYGDVDGTFTEIA